MAQKPVLDPAVIENGLDFLRSAIDDSAANDPNRYKYAILHLFAGIEILVKVRLAREHWTLLLAEPGKAKVSEFTSGDFRSVGAAPGLARLRDISGVSIPEEQIRRVRAVESVRNRVAHFAVAGYSEERVVALMGQGLDFVLWFLDEQFPSAERGAESAAIGEFLEDTRTDLGRIRGLVAERMNSLATELARSIAVACAECSQLAFVLREQEFAVCRFCLYEPTAEVAADRYVSDVLGESEYRMIKQGGIWPVHECTECGVEALVEGIQVFSYQNINWGCFACGFTATGSEMENCSNCSAVIRVHEGVGMCSNCIAYYRG